MSVSRYSITGCIAAALFAAGLAPATASAQPAALSGGSVLLGGQASFDVESAGDDGDNITRLVLLPAVHYFIRPGLAFGGELRLTRVSQGDLSGTSIGAGPALSYYFVQDGAVHPFVRASVQAVRSSSDDFDQNVFGMRAAGGLLFLLTESVGLDAALYYNRLQYGGDADGNTTNVGLALGVSAFVF